MDLDVRPAPGVMRATRPASRRRPARVLAVVAALTLAVAATLALGPRATGAHAQVPSVATFFGFVAADADGALPIKVRAIGATPAGGEPAVCGTADVLASGDAAGFYLLTVVSSAAREGCPDVGEDVRFLLLYGAVDPGVEAGEHATWLPMSQRLDLAPGAEVPVVGGFEGTLPAGPGYALLRWSGPDRTPVGQAILTLPREVQVVFRLGARTVQRYVPNAPDFVSDLHTLRTGDFVAVYVK